MGGGRNGQKRGRTQRRHFKQNRENVWKKTRSLPSSDINDNRGNPDWQPLATENLAFEEYYKQQHPCLTLAASLFSQEQEIVPAEEWEEFLQVLRKPLPAAFRINSSGQFFKDIRTQLENDFMKCLEAEVTDDNEVEAIRPLPWYPDNLAWHLNFSRMQLRKNQTLERFHEFLKQENEIGNITRQEAVSMVPPLFLDVHSDHFVLDSDVCCTRIQDIPITGDDTSIIANDVDVQRCNLLIHQTKRMCSANLIVTNHEAQHFPSCILKSNYIDDGSRIAVLKDSTQVSEGTRELSKRQLLFDRALCDVPCSGDGTLRKAPDIWRKWNAGMGNGLHRLQVQIAMRGLTLLKVGGRMVYSTCSMNPVENEAVVAEVLRRCGDAVELLDVSTELPQLVRRPGLKKWKVRDKGLWLAAYKDVPRYRRPVILPSMFPSGENCDFEGVTDDAEMDKPNDLCEESSCSGLKGSHQNGSNHSNPSESGEPAIILKRQLEYSGYFLELARDWTAPAFPFEDHGNAGLALGDSVASKNPVESYPKEILSSKKSSDKSIENILEIGSARDDSEKKLVSTEAASDADLPGKGTSAMPMEIEANEETAKKHKLEAISCENGGSGVERRKGDKGRPQMQGKWRGVDPVVFFRDDSIINSIRTFYGVSESFPFDGHLVTRNSDIQLVKRIYYVSKSVHDVLEFNFQGGQQLKITSLGLKIFERQTSKEGTSRCAYRISSEGLPLLLPYISKQILSASFADFEHLLRYRTIKFADFVDATFGEKASKLILGCCVVVLNQGDESSSGSIVVDPSTVAIGCWKGRSSLTVMVSQTDCKELLERLYLPLGKKAPSVEVTPQDVSEPTVDALENADDTSLTEDFEANEEAA
ncbi:hypothetical protein ACLOJK_013448 [Asimina triloba]